MKSSASRRRLRLALAASAALAVLVAAARFAPAALLGLPAVRSVVAHQLGRTLAGDVAWQSLDVQLLPQPRIVASGITLARPGGSVVRIQGARAGLRLLPLLLGRLELASLELNRPSAYIDLGPSALPAASPPADPVAAYRDWIAPGLKALQRSSPDADFVIAGGELHLHSNQVPDVKVQELWLHARSSAGGIDLEAGAAGNFWREIHLLGRWDPADRSARVSLAIRDGLAQAWIDKALSGSATQLQIPTANIEATFRADDASTVECQLGVDVANARILHAGSRLALGASAFAATALWHGQELSLIHI